MKLALAKNAPSVAKEETIGRVKLFQRPTISSAYISLLEISLDKAQWPCISWVGSKEKIIDFSS